MVGAVAQSLDPLPIPLWLISNKSHGKALDAFGSTVRLQISSKEDVKARTNTREDWKRTPIHGLVDAISMKIPQKRTKP
jgi:hypothetical protein